MTASGAPGASPLLPVALDVRGKLCLVIGGGAVALHKARALLGCAARVRVVGIAVRPELQTLDGVEAIAERAWSPEDCRGCDLVFACTPAAETNRDVARAARAAGAWCNVATGGEGDFTMMAAVRRGDITVGISTAGGSPALARHLQRLVEGAVGVEFGELLEIMAERRGAITAAQSEQSERAALWGAVLASEALSLLRLGRRGEAEAVVDAILKGESGVK